MKEYKKYVILVFILVALLALLVSYHNFNISYFEEGITIRERELATIGDNSDLEELYAFYRNLTRPFSEDYALYVFSTYDDVYLSSFVEGWSLESVITFVQDIPYAKDVLNNATFEYPKYPIETIVDNCGDCEDKSILAVSLLDILGYDVALLRLPNHMAISVNGSFVDVTNKGSAIGVVPDKYKDVVPIVHNISCRPILVHNWNGSVHSFSNEIRYVRINVTVENLGCNSIDSVTLYLYVNNVSNDVLLSLDEFSSVVVEFVVEIPKGEIDIDTRLEIK